MKSYLWSIRFISYFYGKKSKVQFTKDFKTAFSDYYELLSKGYPQKSILKLVSDLYKLSGAERAMLYRGVSTKVVSEKRIKKLGLMTIFSGTTLHIDGLNQLLTIASYLNGSLVFISTDGYLRDASEIHGNAFQVKFLDKAALLLLQYLKEFTIASCMLYLDEKVNQSMLLAHKMKTLATKENIEIDFILSESVDQNLKGILTGFIATSDSQIIDNAKVPVIDLARNILEKQFQPYFINLKSLQNKNT
jgi:hypothetical protein